MSSKPPPPAPTAATLDCHNESSTEAATLALPERYEDLRQLGSGGFGQVRRVWDRKLKRTVAMKILHPEVELSAAMRARFLAEIELTAQLSHPGIVAVHDFGELDDGRLWFTMAEVQGRTLRSIIDEAFRAGSERVERRRLLDFFARACETMAYAHSRGVIHRDLKPANMMIGAYAEVLVMDWGIARHVESLSRDALDPSATPSPDGLTRAGDILGTPAYMAPEQARGEVMRHSPATDTYALGAILHDVLTGRPPPAAWKRAKSEESLLLADAADIPPELVAICRRALAIEQEARYADAGALAQDVQAFLAGARRRERALEALASATALGAELASIRSRAAEARTDALRALAGVRPFDPVESKLPGWDREDEAERLEREASLRETEWIQAVHSALAVDPDLPEAHAALANHYREKLLDAEQARRLAEAASFEVLLRAHDRGAHAAFLRGDGALTLVTDPPGARVRAHRYVVSKRRLVETPGMDLGQTPLYAVALPHGSYLLRIDAPGCREVRYPVRIGRSEHWDGVPPGSSDPFAIVLPGDDELDSDDVYIPAGYASTGGDPQAGDSLPRRRIWMDAFILRKYAFTVGELLVFLNDLADATPSNEALGLPAAHPGVLALAPAMPWVRRNEEGRFVLREPTQDVPVHERWPAHVDGHVAVAITRWLAARSGKAWRLPDELEREKAARGVDGRLFPWGDQPEPTFACVLEVHKGKPSSRPVDEFPTDVSPYGIRGLGGHTRDWCANVWKHEGSRVVEGHLELEEAAPEDEDFRAIRGGAWGSSITHSRAAARFGNRPSVLTLFVGVRAARSYPGYSIRSR